MEDRVKELETMIKRLQEEKNKKPKFSKIMVAFIVLLVMVFTIAVLYVFLEVGSEPMTLIGAFFTFATVELWSLASIKKTEVNKKESDEYEQYDN